MADRADRYKLYQESVQDTEGNIELFDREFSGTFGEVPLVLREDFCGTGLLCRDWVNHRPNNKAYGVDIDPEPMRWGLANNCRPDKITAEAMKRLVLKEGDARRASCEFIPQIPRADIVSAQNFSWFIFKERGDLFNYIQSAYDSLGDKGLLFMDIYGGPEARQSNEDEREQEDYDYVWDQELFDPINSRAVCHIHFRFPDGSAIERAFTYDWRMWTIQEARELMEEAGFQRSYVLWEEADDEGEGTGEFTRIKEIENEDAWIAYVVGVKSVAASCSGSSG